MPASYCGIYGFRPTRGAISTAGVMPLAQSFDTVGLLARDPSHLQRAAEVLLGKDGVDAAPPSRLLLSPVVIASAEPEIEAAARAAARDLASRLSASVSETELFDEAPSPEDGMAAFNVLQGAQVWRNYGEWIERSSPSPGPDVVARFERAAGFTKADVEQAEPVAHAVAAAVARLGPGEALVLPATGTPAPAREAGADERERARVSAGQLTSIATLAGAPAVAMPLLEVRGLPVGISLVGAPGSDVSLLAAAAASAARAEPS